MGDGLIFLLLPSIPGLLIQIILFDSLKLFVFVLNRLWYVFVSDSIVIGFRAMCC
jgi:hypothetical protein